MMLVDELRLPGRRPPEVGPIAPHPMKYDGELARDSHDEAKIVALERMVGRQALEIEFLKGALQQGRVPRSAPMSVIAGPVVSPSLKDAD